MCYRGEEKHGKKREERQLARERSIGRGETRVSDSEGVKREKVREFIVRESRCQIFFVSRDYRGYGKR